MVNHAAKDFVLVVLMCSWLSNATLEHVMVWTVLDLFCGKARVSKLATHCGIRTRSFDIKLGKRKQGKKGRRCPLAPRNPMDINGHSGFVFPSCILCLSFIYPIYIYLFVKGNGYWDTPTNPLGFPQHNPGQIVLLRVAQVAGAGIPGERIRLGVLRCRGSLQHVGGCQLRYK